MSAYIPPASTGDVDLALRLLDANGLSHRLLADPLVLPVDDVVAATRGSTARLRMVDPACLALFCAILIRLEIRFGHEPRAVR